MGNVTSTVEHCAAVGTPVSCDVPGIGEFELDGDIAGIGVVFAFEFTVFATLVASSILLYLESRELFHLFHGDADTRDKNLEQERKSDRARYKHVGEAAVVSFSDQQLVTGLSTLIATMYFLGCGISAYHYDIVCNLVMMSVITHLSSLTVISGYFSNPVLGTIRWLAIGMVFAFASLFLANRNTASFPTEVPSANATSPLILLPAACFESENATIPSGLIGAFESGSEHSVGGYAEFIVLVMFSVVVMILAPIHSHLTSPSRTHAYLRWRQVTFCFRVVVIICGWFIAGFATLKLSKLRVWMHDSEWPTDTSEYDWRSLGQLVPCFMLVLAPLALIETFVDTFKERRKQKKVHEA